MILILFVYKSHIVCHTPDMFVAIVPLSNYARQHNGMYQSTVDAWLCKARTKWIDPQTGLIKSFLVTAYERTLETMLEYGFTPADELPILGAYSALNCTYSALIDEDFAREQYDLLKKHFLQMPPVAGIRCAFLTPAELAGTTITRKNQTHYHLANLDLVGEAITLAIRTIIPTN